MARRTPLYDRHMAAGARMAGFAGYDMPLQYTGMREEHMAVRERAGLFDISHMGEVYVTGPGALQTVNALVANDVAGLIPGRALYGVMCNAHGGIVDDVVVYRDDEETFMVVVNAGCREKDVAWIGANLAADCSMTDRSDATALLAVQGPLAVEVVGALTDSDIATLRPFRFTWTAVAGVPVRVSRTGYTGEDGFELYLDAGDAPHVWDAIVGAGTPAGLRPAGLGARDTLRLEAGLRLYGQDIGDTTDPLAAGLGWTVKLDRGDFLGRDALLAIRDAGPSMRFVGLSLSGRAIARHGQSVRVEGRDAGEITSGTFSFSLGHGIATAYVATEDGEAGRTLQVDIRGTAADATVCTLPFYKRQPPRAPEQ